MFVDGQNIPSSSFSKRRLVRFSDHGRIQSIQGHLSAFLENAMAGTAFANKAEEQRSYKGGRDAQAHRSHRSWAVLSKQVSDKEVWRRTNEEHPHAGVPIKLRAEGHLHIQGRMGTWAGWLKGARVARLKMRR